MHTTIAHLAVILALAAWPLAQVQAQQAAVHSAHTPSAHAAATASASTTSGTTNARQALDQSMGRMHEDMMRGIAHDDADVAFAAGMLAHHEGAVDMARIQLQYGKDAAMRTLAEDVIRAQESEMIVLKNWLAERGLGADGHPLKPSNPHAGH